MIESRNSMVDFSKQPAFVRLSPYKCVISNDASDFVCHTIFIISSSDYFYTLYKNSEEKFEIEPGHFVPRIRVKFNDNLIHEYVRFAYTDEMQITKQNVEELLKFAVYLTSSEMVALVEKFLCEISNTLVDSAESLKEYLEVAEHYHLEQFKQKLTAQIGAPGTIA